MVCCVCFIYVFFCKQKTAYEMRISDWSSDVCSSDLINIVGVPQQSGDKVGVTVTRPIASRTNTGAGNRRTPSDPTDTTDEGGYHCRQTNYDHAIKYAKLDAWRHKPEFQTLLRDVILKQQEIGRAHV